MAKEKREYVSTLPEYVESVFDGNLKAAAVVFEMPYSSFHNSVHGKAEHIVIEITNGNKSVMKMYKSK